MSLASAFLTSASFFVLKVSDNPTDEEIPDSEKKIISVLQNRFTDAKTIRVNDVSGMKTHAGKFQAQFSYKIFQQVCYILGGCGAMFDITVISPEFKDMSIVKQHKMVTEVSFAMNIENKIMKREIWSAYLYVCFIIGLKTRNKTDARIKDFNRSRNRT